MTNLKLNHRYLFFLTAIFAAIFISFPHAGGKFFAVYAACEGCQKKVDTCGGGGSCKETCRWDSDRGMNRSFCDPRCPSGCSPGNEGNSTCSVMCESPNIGCANNIDCICVTPKCDSSCGTCGYRNAQGNCDTPPGDPNACCHRECHGCICTTVSNSWQSPANNTCENDNQHPDGNDKDLSCCQPGPTNTPIPTPTSTPPPHLDCDDACDLSNDRCSPYACIFVHMLAGTRCRNSACSTEQNCQCPSLTPTPTATPISTPTLTPISTPTNTPTLTPTVTPTTTPYPPTSTPIPTDTPNPTSTTAPGEPTNTPVPTYTPYPTNTPYPPTNTPPPPPGATNTPTPTSPPPPPGATNTPTPTPFASCDCEDIEVEGTLTKGQKLRFKTWGKVDDPDNNKAVILNMVYHVDVNGKEDPRYLSSEIPAIGPIRTTDQNGKPIDRYYTTWEWTIPTTGGEIEYKIWVKINCGWKTATAASIDKNQKVGFFSSIFNFLGRIFGFTQTTSTPAPTPTPVVYVPKDARSLQLGTFVPSTATLFEKGCHIERYPFVRFRIR